MKRLILALVFTAAIFSSCQKEETGQPESKCWECQSTTSHSVINSGGDFTVTKVEGIPYELCNYSQAEIDNHILASKTTSGNFADRTTRTVKCYKK